MYTKMNRFLSTRSNIVRINRESLVSLSIVLSLIILTLYPLTFPGKAHAAVNESFVRFNRLETGAPVSGTACLNTGTTGTETNVTIVFPTDWTINTTPANWTVTTTNLPTAAGGGTATAWPNIAAANGTGGGVVGTSVTFGTTGSGDLTPGTFYCFNFAGASSTIGPAGNNKTGMIQTKGGSPFVDTVDWATSIVSTGGDQITVTASVSATMTFSLSGNSVNLGTLSTSSVNSGTGITQTVATNARNGWISWVRSANAGLDSATSLDTIDSAAWTSGSGNIVDLSGTTGYVLDVNAGTGSPTIATEYNGTGDVNEGGNLDTQFRQTATRGVPTSGDTAVLRVRTKPDATVAAASDYTDTLTVVASGSF
jgi:hypothetical protein